MKTKSIFLSFLFLIFINKTFANLYNSTPDTNSKKQRLTKSYFLENYGYNDNTKKFIETWFFKRHFFSVLSEVSGVGAAPMWGKCHVLSSELNLLQGFVQYFIVQPVLLSVPIVNLVEVLKNSTDIIVGYAATAGDYNCLLTSASIKTIVYHELGHASHFAQAGCDNWQVYRTRISNELCCGEPEFRPYGQGNETNAGIVAVGEMWGNHCEKIFSERHYTNPVRETFSIMQGRIYVNNGSPITTYAGVSTSTLVGLNANFASIENFDPNLDITVDRHRWIPQGLCYDLIDPAGEIIPVIDNVSGYTTQQCFNALQSDVRTIPAFRDRLLQQNGNNQFVNVNDLVFRYGY